MENDNTELEIHILRECCNKGIGTKAVKCLIENLKRVKMMQDMGKEKFEKIIQGTCEDTQRYILCYRLGL